MQHACMGPWNIMSIAKTRTTIYLNIVQKLQYAGFHSYQPSLYREDYIRLGIKENASKEEIKAAYFVKAKLLHPDSQSRETQTTETAQTEFLELNEAYKRLMYESKHGTDSFDKLDPRNDPRKREYWEIRTRRQSTEEIKFEEMMANRARDKERTLLRKIAVALVLGIFFGTIFPALFIGGQDYENDFSHGCQCERCLLKKLRENPTIRHLKKSDERDIMKCSK